VKKNGGTDAANAAKADKAENWLNSPDSAARAAGRTRSAPTARPRRSR
jgi:hypothetical protein